jgi:1,4-alpha-glucan branching enzyme
LIVCALDTELLGHWWYEGIEWLRCVIAECRAAGIELATMPRALEHLADGATPLRESTWGEGKDFRTWDSAAVASLVWPAREAELQLVGLLSERAFNGSPDLAAAAARAARELLALQSSDWAFMASRQLAADYPEQRVRNHARAFDEALAALALGVRDLRAMSAGTEDERSANGAGSRVDARLRGLAPGLELAPLLAPSSPWGRQSAECAEG